MNVHHLELFYYVARHGGIMAACRHIPYGVQQPAVSAQLITLERNLGLALFQRKPFSLTPAGKHLYDFITPLFSEMGRMESFLQDKLAQELRVAGLSEVLRDHVPYILPQMKKTFPRLKVKLYEAHQNLALELLEKSEADLAVTVLEEGLPKRFQSKLLVKLPLGLLVPEALGTLKTAELLKRGAAGKLELVALPGYEMLPKLFAQELRRRNLVWPGAIEASSVDLVSRYVAEDMGVGLCVKSPSLPLPKGTVFVPLTGFPTLPIGAFWKGDLFPVPSAFLEAVEKRAEGLRKGMAG
jgi:DNA-binding transcriptional LysR family regulator